ncbi:glycosyltransferase [Microbacterium sp. HM58-2]|nr:glycosyltransferase [Microbacterium sp. HM58-2]
MSNETENQPDITLDIVNYPPSGSEVELVTMAFGPMGPMRVMLDMDVTDEGVAVKITVSNAAEHADLPEFLRDVAEMLNVIVASPELERTVDLAVAEVN